MPELPSLVIFKKYFDSTSLNQKIEKVIINNPEILQNTTSTELKDTLINEKFICSSRYGKYLFAQTKTGSYLIFHFGMTGSLIYHPQKQKHSPHARISILFNGGYVLDFEDPRKFGKIGLTSNISEFIIQKRLGPDALKIDYELFKKIFKKRKGSLKPLLMNQHFIAGIGNLYADETLYQSEMHPLERVANLKEEDINLLYRKMKMVLEKAIEFQDNLNKFPPEFLLAHRHPGCECPDGGKLEILKVGGRTTYYCPQKQKLRGN